MNTVIYIDVLIALNLFVNYFILLATAKFLKLETNRKRIILAASLGAFYSLYILVPQYNMFVSFIVKIIMSLTIILIAFGFKNTKVCVRVTLCFYLISFGFSGVMFALWYFVSPNGLLMKNGVVYFNISPIMLVIATLISYILIRIIHTVTGQRVNKKLFYDLEIEVDNKKVKLRGKIDTGNNLVEPFSNLPVVVVDYKYVESIIPIAARNFFCKKDNNVNSDSHQESWMKKCRMIPFKVVSSNGILPAFKPDKLVIIKDKDLIEKNAYIAVSSSGELGIDFEALINPTLID